MFMPMLVMLPSRPAEIEVSTPERTWVCMVASGRGIVSPQSEASVGSAVSKPAFWRGPVRARKPSANRAVVKACLGVDKG